MDRIVADHGWPDGPAVELGWQAGHAAAEIEKGAWHAASAIEMEYVRMWVNKLVATTASVMAGAMLFASPAAAGVSAAAPAGTESTTIDSGDLGTNDFDPNPTIAGNGIAVPAPHYATGARGVSAPSYLPSCPHQRVCVAVLDYQNDQINTWKIWDLYQCGDYSLYNWYSRGWIRNNQSGGAVTYRLDSNSSTLSPSHPVNNRWLDANWEPAWHIRPC
jgi:hypothetical protein